MKENKDEPEKVSTCFEGLSCAEMMQKIMGKEGIGSLCEKMMRSWTKKNEGREEKDQAPRTAKAENKNQRKGDKK
jgi:hypothetical protein